MRVSPRRLSLLLPLAAATAILAAVPVITGGGPAATAAPEDPQFRLDIVGSYQADAGFDEAGAEIVAYEAGLMYVVNGDRRVIEVVSLADPSNPRHLYDIDIARYGGDITSVAVRNGLIAAAVPSADATRRGQAVFFNATGRFVGAVTAGVLPDAITFSPDGAFVVVSNEGQPNDDYSVDPEGSVTIVTVRTFLIAAGAGWQLPSFYMLPGRQALLNRTARQVDFRAFNVGASRHGELPEGVRISGPGASVAQDLEPEYAAISPDSRTAYVTLQENNAVAVIDILRGRVTRILALGTKDHMLPGNELDASDRDDAVNIRNWPVSGMYMPDGIASYRTGGQTYFVTANEGDAREYDGYADLARVKDLGDDGLAPLCDDVFTDGDLTDDDQIGRLRIVTTEGLRAGGDCYEKLVPFGARSFSIWASDGTLVFDSGANFEHDIVHYHPNLFNASNDDDNRDTRSDDKGPEPEGVTVAQFNGRWYAFMGLERVGGVMVYDITNPAAAFLIDYDNYRTLDVSDPDNGPMGPDLGPEGLVFVPAAQSPNGKPLVLVANEVSATVTIWAFEPFN